MHAPPPPTPPPNPLRLLSDNGLGYRDCMLQTAPLSLADTADPGWQRTCAAAVARRPPTPLILHAPRPPGGKKVGLATRVQLLNNPGAITHSNHLFRFFPWELTKGSKAAPSVWIHEGRLDDGLCCQASSSRYYRIQTGVSIGRCWCCRITRRD